MPVRPGARCTCAWAAKATRTAPVRALSRRGTPIPVAKTINPATHYYECLDGTWDANGDHTYGEIADSPDLCADVYVGRIPLYNVAMAQNFVRKVLTYE